MAESAPMPMTIEEFFVWQDGQDVLYELVDGRPVPKDMTGATQRHDLVVVNAIASFRQKLRGGPCRPTTDDVALRTRPGSLRRPDMTVECAPLVPTSMESAGPTLVLEVLSRTTANIDRFVTVDEYKAHPDLRYILLADSGTPHVLLYTRGEDGTWSSLDHIGPDSVLDLPALGCTVALADLYEGVPA